MTCQVVISDYVAERRMAYLLEAPDFHIHSECWNKGDDELLAVFRDHPFFAGCNKWPDLNVTHFHALIINILGICAGHTDAEVADKTHPAVQRLTFFLCSMILLLQQKSGCEIDLLRLHRVRSDDVLYDYSARLEVSVILPPKPGFRIVIDND